ncbi:MAG: hypothetical protein IKN36_07225 [Clostridia bacterium]|nr:hypothetical protein [Clostridia bacterium]
MSRKKYINDYKIEREVDGKGRIKSTARYAGGYFRFTGDEAAVFKKRTILAAAAAVAVIAYVAALIPRTAAMHLAYFSLPFIFTAIPIYLLIDCVVSLYREKSPFKRRTADKFTNRVRRGAVILMVFSAGSAVGFIVGTFVERSRFSAIDAVPAASAVLLFGVAAVAFSMKDAFAVAEIPKTAKAEDAEEEKD